MGFHMVPHLKKMVWLKFLYIQKTDELLLETVEWSDWWKIHLEKRDPLQDLLSSLNAWFQLSTNENT